MRFSSLLGLGATIVSAQALSTGFNYGNMMGDDGQTPKDAATYELEFKRAQTLQGTDGAFTSARIYTMIQAGTDDTPTAAIPAAIKTKTTLLLGMWASVDQATFQNEINALKNAIQQYGTAFTSLVVGISVGSEDLYRISPTGIENDSGYGQSPNNLVTYIKQTRDAIKGTGLANAKVGHVDTWTAWVNGSNAEVTDNCDWLGVDSYPYYQNTVQNSIENANKTFWQSVDATAGAGKGKEVWVTETGWPTMGKTDGLAVASVKNAETYWQDVACSLIGNYNTWWYILDDAGADPAFGLTGQNLNDPPLYDLQCKPQSTSASGSGGSGTGTPSKDGASAAAASASSSSQPNSATKAGAAAGAGILAIVALMVTL